MPDPRGGPPETPPGRIDTPFGEIVPEQVTATKYRAGSSLFETEGDARAELRRNAFVGLRDFAYWVAALHGDIPEENVREVMPILRAVRQSGLDFAAMTAALGGGQG